MNNVGKTAFGVKMGCQAFNRCCLKAVSTPSAHCPHLVFVGCNILAGRFENLTFSFWVGSGSSWESLFLFFLLKIAIVATVSLSSSLPGLLVYSWKDGEKGSARQ
jgi:hypothetical protein